MRLKPGVEVEFLPKSVLYRQWGLRRGVLLHAGQTGWDADAASAKSMGLDLDELRRRLIVAGQTDRSRNLVLPVVRVQGGIFHGVEMRVPATEFRKAGGKKR